MYEATHAVKRHKWRLGLQ